MCRSAVGLLLASLLLPLLPASAMNPPDHLRQRNSAKEAPTAINTTSTTVWDAYPWFSRDGKLLFWTREANGKARVWVTYFKNRGTVINKSAGATLPDLSISAIKILPGSWNDPQDVDETIKAYAYCHQALNDNTPDSNHQEYVFTLFYSTGPIGTRVMYRISNLVVRVNKSTLEIDYLAAPSSPQIMGSGVNVSGKNATEPMLTRDGKFFFWASNAGSFSPMARYIEVSQECTQLNQSATQYSSLPSNRFKWVDQYTVGNAYDLTRSSNYHTVLEKGSIANSETALIFERCNERDQQRCDENEDSRYCDCVSTDDDAVPLAQRYGVLMSTGFGAGSEPAPIKGCYNPSLNQDYPGRDTHPAISGPPTTGGTWLLFFMRNKKIWYTNIAECSGSGCTC